MIICSVCSGPTPVENIPVPAWPVKKTSAPVAPSVISGIPNRKLVLDTAAFIARVQFAQFGSEYYTIPEVLKEVRDGKARIFMDSLPITIKTREPSAQAYTAIVEFSKKTGDFPTLSKVDLKVLALAYMLEVEVKGSANHLRSTPITAEVLNKPANGQVYLPKAATDQSPKTDPDVTSSILSDEIPTEEPLTNIDSEIQGGADDKSEGDSDSWSDSGEEGELVGFGDFDSDDDEGWIGANNIKDYTKTYLGRQEGPLESDKDVKVSTLTTDFAMQNVLLQLGLHLTSPDGVTIKRLQQWILRCFACFRLCRDMTKLFCPTCGNNTLQRVQCSVDVDGHVTLTNVKTNVTTRGTIYSIPKPKGGCKAKNLILSASSIPNWMSLQRHKETYHDDGSFASKPARHTDAVVVGYGRRNPNEVRGKAGKRKRRRV